MAISEEMYLQSNQYHWNKRVSYHLQSEFYNLEGFYNGRNMLNPVELTALGDVSGKSLLHLQCHFGLDTLSWARLGADVTGVDFSEQAILAAREIAEKAGIEAGFICSDIYNLPNHLDADFDIIFTSYGVISWLPDLRRWAEVIARHLKPGGTFYMVEFHPMIGMLDVDFNKLEHSYFNTGVIKSEYTGSYAAIEAPLEIVEYAWNHSISEVVNALLANGLEIIDLEEYDFSSFDCFPNMLKTGDGRYQAQGFEGILPLLFSVKARKRML